MKHFKYGINQAVKWKRVTTMKKLAIAFLLFFTSVVSHYTYAMLNLELTRGIAGAVPIAIIPFSIQGGMPPQDVSGIISQDLNHSGRFKVRNPRFTNDYRSLGIDNVVVGEVQGVGGGRYQVRFKLLDVFKGSNTASPVLISKTWVVSSNDLRVVAHRISDLVYKQVLGVRGIFSTRLAYIVVQRSPQGKPIQYTLEVTDQDGFNPRPLLTSSDPIMSPAWSPNGKQIAYVSFEKKHAAIFIEDVATGTRRLVSEFIGINGAPAWSPDGRKLALVLSKSGAPNIYVLSLATRQLTQLTNDYYINTEPAWAPNGKSLLFTSNRGGTPQIYKMNLATRAVARVTYDGKYNARASYTPDGSHIVVLNQDSGLFNIGILDLDTNSFRVLTNGSRTDNDSPSIAPNGSMILYGTVHKGRSMLGMIATDGSIQLRLPGRNGEVQDPAWSPFLS